MSKRSWSVANAAQGLLDMNSVIGIGSRFSYKEAYQMRIGLPKCYKRYVDVSTTDPLAAGFS